MSPSNIIRRQQWHLHPLVLASFLMLTVFFLAGCSGDSNSGGGGGGPTAPQPSVTLTPDSGNTPSVSLVRGAATEGANLVLEIQANELQDVRTIDFVLSYPGNLMRAISVQAGDFLGINASVITTALNQSQLQILMTRVVSTGVSGDGLIATISFEGTTAGSGRIEFVDPEAANPAGVPISGIEWLGGDVEVSP